MTARTRAGGAAALALTGLAGLHAYWARGGLWPGHDPASLGETVVGPGAELPPSPAVWAVAGLLGASAAAVATTTALREPPGLARTMTRVTGGVLLARAAASPSGPEPTARPVGVQPGETGEGAGREARQGRRAGRAQAGHPDDQG